MIDSFLCQCNPFHSFIFPEVTSDIALLSEPFQFTAQLRAAPGYPKPEVFELCSEEAWSSAGHFQGFQKHFSFVVYLVNIG